TYLDKIQGFWVGAGLSWIIFTTIVFSFVSGRCEASGFTAALSDADIYVNDSCSGQSTDRTLSQPITHLFLGHSSVCQPLAFRYVPVAFTAPNFILRSLVASNR